MANTITAFLETLVAASGEYNAAKVGTTRFLDSVYLDVRPEVARAGKTIDIYFPDMGSWSDQAANDWSPTDINPSYVSVVFNQRPGQSILIRDFEQWQTAVEIADKFLDPMYKRGQEYINGQLAAQITNANFNTYSPVVGGTNGEIKLADLKSAWSSLAGNKVPVDDSNDLVCMKHTDVHATMMTDSDWYQESLVGIQIAQKAREVADLGVAFNFRQLYDQQAGKKNGTALTGTVSGTSGSKNVTGSGTTFTTQVEAGDRLTIAGDTTVYVVASVTDDTHLVLTANLASSPSGAVATQAGYTCVAMHRYAIALALRPLELVNDGHVQSRIIVLKGIPFRVTVSYQHLKAGWLMTMDTGCAVKVIRPDFGCIIKV